MLTNSPFYVRKESDGYGVYMTTRPDDTGRHHSIIIFHGLPSEEMAMGFLERFNDALLYYLEENLL